jgi:fatty-acyl-CoA synthase
MTAKTVPTPSITAGPPLSEEPGLGSLTLPGFLRDVTSMYGDREALVYHSAGSVTRWTYDELWEQAEQVAAALRASGVGKDTRVGLLMTNRPEWVSAFFGISMAGGVAVALSTFSTPAELEYLLTASNERYSRRISWRCYPTSCPSWVKVLPEHCNPRNSHSFVIS